MFNEVLQQVVRVIQFCLDFVMRIFDGLGATGFVFGAFACAVVFRLLLVPILGSRADFTKRETKASNGNDKETIGEVKE